MENILPKFGKDILINIIPDKEGARAKVDRKSQFASHEGLLYFFFVFSLKITEYGVKWDPEKIHSAAERKRNAKAWQHWKEHSVRYIFFSLILVFIKRVPSM